MRLKLLSVFISVYLWPASAFAATLTLSIVNATDGASSVTVRRNTVVNYHIRGVLDNTGDNDGLAFWSADLEFVPPATIANHTSGAVPAGMSSFVRTDGFTNPAGYNGTPFAEKRVQIGGGQNTIHNDTAHAPFPVGTVTLNVANSIHVLAQGSYLVPDTADIDSRHVLTLTHCLASVINQGQGGPTFDTRPVRADCASAELTITVDDPPAATVTAAITRKPNPNGPGNMCDLALSPVTSEPRQGGVTQVRIAFDVAPGDPPANASGVTLEQKVCPPPGTYSPYSGASVVTGSVVGGELVLSFVPGLENARTYRINMGQDVTTMPGQYVEVRGLIGDVNSDGGVNSTDRSVVVGVWTGSGFTCASDVNSDGVTNSTDRSIVVGAWTGSQNCAP